MYVETAAAELVEALETEGVTWAALVVAVIDIVGVTAAEELMLATAEVAGMTAAPVLLPAAEGVVVATLSGGAELDEAEL